MASSVSARGAVAPERPEGFREMADRRLGSAMELVVLLLVCLSPWGFGSVETVFELLLYMGVTLLAALWGLRMLVRGQLTWKKCPVAVCLGALFLVGIGQLTPLPRPVLGTLSPAAARLYDTLLPARPEVLPQGAEREPTPWPPGSTLSLYPTATRIDLVRLLAVFLLFTAVRNNVASPAALRRLAVVALVNGTLLALFALVQFFSSPRNTVYWTYPTAGAVFGPFLNRNHFAFYINLCVGLGAGLLARPERVGAAAAVAETAAPEGGRGASRRRRRAGRGRDAGRPQYRPAEVEAGAPLSPLGLLQDPRTLWVVLPLTLMVSSMAFSLSRGGVLAAAAGAVVCLPILLFRARRLSRLSRLAPLATAGALLVAALLLWLGFDRIADRFSTLWEGRGLEASRLALWSTALPLARDFPVCGTGLGTYTYVEALHRTNPEEAAIAYEHAHNEYLELLVEGGGVGLLLGLLAAGLVFRFAGRAAVHGERNVTRGLALGALFALTAAAVHAFVEFGLHIPAITVLLTVLGAQVCALRGAAPKAGPGTPGPADEGAGSDQYALKLWGVAPVAGALTAVALGLVLIDEGLKAHLVQRYLAAARANQEEPQPGGRERQIANLEAAAHLAPEYAQLRSELGQAHLEAFEDWRRLTEGGHDLEAELQALLLPAAAEPFPASLAGLAGPFAAGSSPLEEALHGQEEEMTRKHLVPGLQNFLLARDLCPTLARPHVRLADHADALPQADSRRAYLERAKRLVPFDPEIWYFSGLQAVLDGHTDEAWPDWRRCLELSPRRLPDVVRISASHLAPQDLIDRVLPDDPEQLFAAAEELYPDPEDLGPNVLGRLKRTPPAWAARLALAPATLSPVLGGPEPAFALRTGYVPLAPRRPFLEKALALLEQRPGPPGAKELHLKGQVHWGLWQLDRAAEAYRAALAQSGLNGEWRLEYAQLLYQQGRTREAQRELLLLVALPSYPPQARPLLDAITRERGRRGDILQ